jgi:hypothetical protein
MRYHEMIERPANKVDGINHIMDHTNGFWSRSSTEENDDISFLLMESPLSTPPSTPPPLDDDDESVFSMDLLPFDDHPLNSSFDRSGVSTLPTTVVDTVTGATTTTTNGTETSAILPDAENVPDVYCFQQEEDTEWYCDPLFSSATTTTGDMIQVPAVFSNHQAIMLQGPCCIVNNCLSAETGQQATTFQPCPRCILSFALCSMKTLSSPPSSGCLSMEDRRLAVEIMAALYSRLGCPPCCQQDLVGDVTSGGGGGTDSEEPPVVSAPVKATPPSSKRCRRKDPVKKIYVNKTDKEVLF